MLKLCCLLGFAALVAASDVLEWGDSNFEDNAANEDLALVEFFAPWCGHCKKLAPEFEKAATALRAIDPPVALVKVDCTVETSTCSQYGVSGYPTLKVFKNGEMTGDYDGGRDFDGIVKYMKSKAGPVSKDLTSVADAEKFLRRDESAVVGFFESSDGEMYKQFQKLADALSEDFRFAHTTQNDVSEKYGYKDDVVVFQGKNLQNKFEDAEKKYDGDAVLNKLKTWVNDNIHGLCGHRTPSNQEQFKKPLIVAYYDVDYVKNPKGTNYWRNRVMKVGKKLRDEGRSIYFAVSDREDFEQQLSDFGVEGAGDKPSITALDANDKKYIMTDVFSMDNLEKFTNDMLDGNLKPFIKSEPVPEDNDGPVKVLVGENFDEIVNDENKDVLIEFYAPWCGHCKSLAPKYEELGEKMAKETDVVIAKMDATANDVPSAFDVRGFPTIYYVPKRSKSSPKKYEGGREVPDFVKYLAKESTDGLKTYSRDGKKIKSEL